MISVSASSHRTIFPSHSLNPSIFRHSSSQLLHLILPNRRESQQLLLAKKREGSAPRPRKKRKKRTVQDAELAESEALESEILDFMEKSPNPRGFPTKEELIVAGRMDLVEAIFARGGWFAYGWDLDEKEEAVIAEAEQVSNSDDFCEKDGRILQQRFSGIGTSSESGLEASNMEDSTTSSSSDRPIEMEGAEEAGIEGILRRLQKERSLSYVVESQEIEGFKQILKKIDEDNLWGIPTNVVSGSGITTTSTSFNSSKDLFHDSNGAQQNGACLDCDDTRNSLKTEMWRMWSAQRAGLPGTEFEAAEIVPRESGNRKTMDHTISNNVDMIDEMHTVTNSIQETTNMLEEPTSSGKQSYHDQIHSRLQCLDLELTSVLRLLRSRTDSGPSHMGQGSSLEEMHKLSDALEFQETEIMKGRDKLRSIRAKLAVLEGKMALEIIEAQKMVQERQKRFDDAQKALQILRTVCIVWSTHASEVFLAGSFDGWTSQRWMERSSAGMFSLSLKLYPGHHEIKFIVDGKWTVDPLRPIINDNGYENNLLIIS